MAIHIDDAGSNPTTQSKLQETFGRNAISTRGKQKIDSVAGRIHSSIQVRPAARHPDVSSSTRHDRLGRRISRRIRFSRMGA